MDERRKYPRFTIEMNATFFTESSKKGSCKLTDISREGTKIELFSKEKMEIGTGINLEINTPEKETPIATAVIIMWSRKLEDDPDYNYIAGGLLSDINPEDKGTAGSCICPV